MSENPRFREKESACITRDERYSPALHAGIWTDHGAETMSPRTALLGLFAILGMIGQTAQAAAAPPVGTLLEARAPEPTEKPGAWLALTIIVWDALLDNLTVPLGTADLSRTDCGCGA
jgi:hypothetical protein